jgi:hypothetical protein
VNTLNPCGLQTDIDTVYVFQPNSEVNIGVSNWNAGTTVNLTNDFGVTGVQPVAMCYDGSVSTIYALFANGLVRYLTVDTAGGAVIDIDSIYSAGSDHVYFGANIFMHFGRLMVWNGDKLIEIEDPLGTPAATVRYDDGLGPDLLSPIKADTNSDAVVPGWSSRLGLTSDEGIWLAKNYEIEGRPSGGLVRVDRANDGLNIGVPQATMPPGKVILDLQFHLGSVLMTTATDLNRVFGNDISAYGHIPIDIHLYTQQSGLGTVGSPLGYPDPSDTPYRFMGSSSDSVYIGGHGGVWRYDVVQGGLHPWMQQSAVGSGPHLDRFSSVDGSGNTVELFLVKGYAGWLRQVTALTAESAANLESNYFDFNIPAEQKSATHVTLMTSGINAGETWAVDIDTDDSGSWTEVATFTSADSATTKKRFTPQVGYRFRYRLRWSATGAQTPPSRVKGVVFHALQGQMVNQWQLQIDGTSMMNIENQPISPSAVRAWLKTLADTATVVEYVDDFNDDNSPTTYNVKVDQLVIQSDDPHELVAQVVLTEDT